MKMLFLLAAVPALASAAAPREPARPGAVNPPRPMSETTLQACPNAGAQYAQTPLRAEPRRLIDLPPARLELTVLRRFDRCPEPAVLREGIGAQGLADESRRSD